MKCVKVLMLGWEYPPYITGGLGTHCYYLTKAFSKLPVKLYFITPHPIHKKIGNVEIVGLDISQKFKENNKIINYGKFAKEKIKIYTKKVVQIAKNYDFDIIHCEDLMPIKAGITLKKRFKKKLVITIHSTTYDVTKKPKKKFIMRERKGMVEADKIIAVSNYTKDIIVNKHNINPKKISVIINAVEQKKIPFKKKIGKTKYILSLGRLAPPKGIIYLIKAMKKVVKKYDNVKVIISGRGESSYDNTLKQEVIKLGLQKHVKFLDFVNNKEYYYKKAYLFILPSVSEPFGITPLEATSNGTPSIISKQSGVSEVLKNSLKFNYWDTDDLAKKILYLLENKKAYNRLRKGGLKEIRKFTWERIANETLSLYKKILS